MVTCPRCAQQSPDDSATHCSSCGAELSQQPGQEDERRQTLYGYASTQQPAQPDAAPAAENPATAKPPPAAGGFDMDLMAKTIIDGSPDFDELMKQAGGDQAVGPHSREAFKTDKESADELRARLEQISAASSAQAPEPRLPPESDEAPPPEETMTAARPMAQSSYNLASPASLPVNASISLGDTTPEKAPPMDPPAPAPAAPQPAGPQGPWPADPAPVPVQAAARPQASATPVSVQADTGQQQPIPATVQADTGQQQPIPATVQADTGQQQPLPPTVLADSTPRPAPTPPTPAVGTADTEQAPQGAAAPATEPGKGLMRVLMALCGLCLLGLFFVPWDGEHFFWQEKLTGMNFVFRLLLAAGGVVFLAGAAIPIPYLLRGLVAFLVGMAPVALAQVMELKGGSLGSEQIMGLVLLATMVLLPAALFHRQRVRSTVLGRILVLIGFLGVLAYLLVPRGAGMPLILTFRALGGISSATQAVAVVLPLVLLLFTVLSLLAFLPRKSSGLAALWALGLMFYICLHCLHGPLLALINGADFFKAVAPGLFQGLYLTVCLFLASYGLSQVFTRISGGDAATG